MNTNTIKGLELISEGINLILAEAKNAPEIAKDTKKSAEKPVEKETAPATSNDSITEEELESMTYNDLKKLAAELGISPKGNRKELVARLLDSANESSEESEEEEEKPVKKSAPKKTAKSKKVEEPDPEEEEDEDDDVEESEEEVSDLEEAINELSDDELRELLESVDIPSKGKRQALITKVLNAVEDGLIELDLDEDDDEDEESEDDETEVEDTEESDESEDEDDDDEEEEDSVTANMTKKRRKAYDDMCDETEEGFESGEITREDLIAFISEFNGTDAKKMKKTSDEDLLTQYLTIAANFIDDEGEQIEEGAYYINDEPYCCGRPLKYDKKKKQYVCETCGAEYDED